MCKLWDRAPENPSCSLMHDARSERRRGDINVFTVAPDKQQALVESLVETVQAARAVAGWMSASVHRSFDGRQVVNYVQFENHEAAQAVTRHLLGLGLIERNSSLGLVAPGQYEVVHTIGREDGLRKTK